MQSNRRLDLINKELKTGLATAEISIAKKIEQINKDTIKRDMFYQIYVDADTVITSLASAFQGNPKANNDSIQTMRTWLNDKLKITNNLLTDYLVENLSQGGFLVASQTGTGKWGQSKNLHIGVDQVNRRFTFIKNADSSITFTEVYFIESILDSLTLEEKSEKSPVALVSITLKIKVVDGKIQNEIISDNTLLYDNSVAHIFDESYGAVETFIEITPEERKNVPSMQIIHTTGRKRDNLDATLEECNHYYKNDIERGRVIMHLSPDELADSGIKDTYQQDLFSAPISLISTANPNLLLPSKESGKVIIYKNADGKIFADGVIGPIDLTTDLSDSSKKITIPGTILSRYEWSDGDWELQYMGVTDIRLKKLLLAQYPEFAEARKNDDEHNKIILQIGEVHIRPTPAQALLGKERDKVEAKLDKLKPSAQTFIENLPVLPVGGKLGHDVPKCTLDLPTFKNALINTVKQKDNVDISSITMNNNKLIVTANSNISLFKNLGLKRVNNEYHLEIVKPYTLPNPSDPLLAVYIKVGLEQKAINVSPLFTTTEIKSFESQAVAKRENRIISVPNINNNAEQNVLKAIQNVNKYLSKRSQDTSGFFSFFFNSYSGVDYYNRRDSWKLILVELDKFLNKTITIDELTKFIRGQADKFDNGFRTEYRNCLVHLHDALLKLPAQRLDNYLLTRVCNYRTMYYQMDCLKQDKKAYSHEYSIFSTSPREIALKQDIKRDKKIYTEYYEKLDKDDQKDFLNLSEENKAENTNIKHFIH